MKFAKKIAALLVVSAAMIFTAATVSAKVPSIAGTADANGVIHHTVWLYQDKASECGQWKVDPATSIVPIKNLKWNAKIYDITSNFPKKATLCDRQVGTYYLKIKASQYIRPGNSVKVGFVVNQDKKYQYTALSLILDFVTRPTPFALFDVGGVDQAAKFAGCDIASLGASSAIKELAGAQPFTVKMNAGYKRIKNVYTNKKGVAHTFANGNKLRLANLCKVQVAYQATATGPIRAAIGGYYKAENCAYTAGGCKKLFPVRYVATLEI